MFSGGAMITLVTHSIQTQADDLLLEFIERSLV